MLVGAIVTALPVPTASSTSEQSADETAQAVAGPTKASFIAMGDNLANDSILQMADAWSGTTGDGSYDFSPLYQRLDSLIHGYDLAFVNQETVLGGTNLGFRYNGYPSYNTPDSMAQAVSDAGFNVVNFNSNHSYDIGADAIEHAQQVWSGLSNVTLIGSYTSEQDRSNIRVVEKNGIKVAFLSYSYGQNGRSQAQLPNDYYAVPWDADRAKEEVAAAKELADLVVVYMHWGIEYANNPSLVQQQEAHYLASLGVNLVIGSHVHVIQPVRWIRWDTAEQKAEELQTAQVGETLTTAKVTTVDSAPAAATGEVVAQEEGCDSSNATLVVYGLGDFVSGYTNASDCVLSGAFTCDFGKDENGAASITNPRWIPLVEHRSGSDDYVVAVRDYSEEDAAANELLTDQTAPYEWLHTQTEAVIGTVLPIEE